MVSTLVCGLTLWLLQTAWVRLIRYRHIKFGHALLTIWGTLLERPPLNPDVSVTGQVRICRHIACCLTFFICILISHFTEFIYNSDVVWCRFWLVGGWYSVSSSQLDSSPLLSHILLFRARLSLLIQCRKWFKLMAGGGVWNPGWTDTRGAAISHRRMILSSGRWANKRRFVKTWTESVHYNVRQTCTIDN